MLNDFQQRVYNCYLSTTRSALKQPFTLRKDFSDFTEESEYYRYTKKLAMFFRKFPNIDMQQYFRAPFEIYKDGEQYDMKFFISQKAIALYSMYVKRLNDESPDSPDQILHIRNSLVFIIKFCRDNHISIDNYIYYKSPGATTEDFLTHYRNRNVSIYVLLKMPGFENVVYSLDEELRELFFDDVLDKISTFKIRLYKSDKAKPLIEKTINSIKQILH